MKSKTIGYLGRAIASGYAAFQRFTTAQRGPAVAKRLWQGTRCRPTLFIAVSSIILLPSAFSKDYDVCVYGATSGGVVAAIQADRMGKSVILLEPYQHVGGMTSSGYVRRS